MRPALQLRDYQTKAVQTIVEEPGAYLIEAPPGVGKSLIIQKAVARRLELAPTTVVLVTVCGRKCQNAINDAFSRLA